MGVVIFQNAAIRRMLGDVFCEELLHIVYSN
jgi:hypothetical protein